MARKVVVEMVDDIDGTAFGEDGESIHYAVDGVEYVIDLKDEHAKELRETFEYYIAHSTRVGGRKHRSDRPVNPTAGKRPRAKRRRSAPGHSSRATNSPPVDVSPPRSSRLSTTPTEPAQRLPRRGGRSWQAIGMCGRYASTTSRETLLETFEVDP